MPEHKSEDAKKLTVEFYLESDESMERVAEIFQTSLSSLKRWIERYNTDEGKIERKNREPVSYKVTKEHVAYIRELIKNNKTITMEDLTVELKKKFKDFDISRRHINRVTNDLNISLKQTRKRHEPTHRYGKEIDIKKQLEEFYKEVKKYSIDDIICLDETSLNALQVRNHCYEEVGKRCVIKTTDNKVFKKYTGIFAICSKGVVAFEIYETGGIDGERLKEFMKKVLGTKKKKLIIMDNASSHKNEAVKEFIEKDNYLLHSIPYQHFTNGIENFFSVLKSKLNKMEGLTLDKLKENVQNAINIIKEESFTNILKGTYQRTETYTPKRRKHKNKKYKEK